eukprot:3892294-Amphidinium_carterae.1
MRVSECGGVDLEVNAIRTVVPPEGKPGDTLLLSTEFGLFSRMRLQTCTESDICGTLTAAHSLLQFQRLSSALSTNSNCWLESA